MELTLADLNKGEKGIIKEISSDQVPLKLLEMGCLPGNEVELLQLAPFKDPMYLNINGSHLAIRLEIAKMVIIEKISNG
ncbi:MAG: ferrous iron transport protein A [Flavobacteriaceae bacterium]|nr:ferrous iron transport protein A [Flavobacteriaceae bacterium]NNK27023.1 ferrous iron transport protein A [Flavobacteriaceae bacterium]RZV64256.1 MAG: ferrous iron transport protein A [Flavobacteriaceae bacterium]